MSEDYTIFYALDEGAKLSSSSVEIKTSTTVDQVKKMLVKEDMTLNNINPRELELYQVDIRDDQDFEENVKNKMVESPVKLNPTRKMSVIYPSGPPEDTIHFFVRVPVQGE
jgi:Trm5-related predicted tRNA methylase